MHKVTQKRQITIPIEVCRTLDITPGNYVEIFERDGVAHIVKMSNDDLSGKFSHHLKGKEFPSNDEIKLAIKNKASTKFEKQHDCS
jgi:AbrB family looped-hinge helix DNA binding protein